MFFTDEYICGFMYLTGGRPYWKYLRHENVRDYRIFASFFANSKRALAVLSHLEKLGIVEIKARETTEFKACLEKAKADGRIKDPRKYCLKKHPINFRIIVNYEVLEAFWDLWKRMKEKGETGLSFPLFILYTEPGDWAHSEVKQKIQKRNNNNN